MQLLNNIMLQQIKGYSLQPSARVQVMNGNIPLLLLLKCLTEKCVCVGGRQLNISEIWCWWNPNNFHFCLVFNIFKEYEISLLLPAVLLFDVLFSTITTKMWRKYYLIFKNLPFCLLIIALNLVELTCVLC